MTWTKPKPLSRENSKTIPRKAGLYRIHNRAGTPIYLGRSRDLKHRISSYHQVDDFGAHPTKAALRREAHSFSYQISTDQATRRKKEAKLKDKYKHNHY